MWRPVDAFIITNESGNVKLEGVFCSFSCVEAAIKRLFKKYGRQIINWRLRYEISRLECPDGKEFNGNIRDYIGGGDLEEWIKES